jgi:hypothetical protein
MHLAAVVRDLAAALVLQEAAPTYPKKTHRAFLRARAHPFLPWLVLSASVAGRGLLGFRPFH